MRGTVSAVAMTLALAAAQAQAQEQGQEQAQEQAPVGQADRAFQIQAQPLSKALLEFSEQSDIVVTVPYALVDGKQAPAISGAMRPMEALERLLSGSGLQYSLREDSGVTIVRTAASEQSRRADDPIRLTQVAQSARRSEPGTAGRPQATGSGGDDGGGGAIQLEEMVVTGTHIRGVAPVGSPSLSVTRAEIDRAGFATAQSIIQSLPQNFGGGPGEQSNDFSQTGDSSINLRGIGESATLVLLNGRRMPAGGGGASYFDVSMIPATAIERVEVLTDGASATYGSDAIAGVVNFVLRDDYEGAETRLRFGTVTDGGLREYQAAQLFGTTWRGGHAMLSYEYYSRDPLARSERDFTASTDLTAFGGDDFRTSRSNPGNILDPVTRQPAFAIPAGQDGTDLTVDDLLPGVVNLDNLNERQVILPDQERHNAFVSVTQEVTSGIEVFFEGSYGRRDFSNNRVPTSRTLVVPSSNPFFVDPFGGSPFVLVDYNFDDDLGPISTVGDIETFSATLGVEIDLWGDWRLDAYGLYAERDSSFLDGNQVNDAALAVALADPNPQTAFNPFGDGSNTNPATLRSITNTFDTRSDIATTVGNAIVSGSLFDLPGGSVKVAAGMEYREESLANAAIASTGFEFDDRWERDVLSVFGEVNVPLVTDQNALPGLRQLLLSASVRHENYGGLTDASTTNPKVGMVWSPFGWVDFRASYGTSFRVPNLTLLSEGNSILFVVTRSDFRSPSGTSTQLLVLGNNPDVGNETSRAWSLGADLHPAAIPGLSANLTYFNIEFEDRIVQRSLESFTALANPDNEALFGDLITRDPDQAALDAFCLDPGFRFNAGSAADCVAGDIGAIVDGRFNNAARTEVAGIDFTVRYDLDTQRLGRFAFTVNGSYLFDFKEAVSPAVPPIERVDTLISPVDLVMRASIGWSDDSGLSATAFVNYTDSYTDRVSSPERAIKAHTTVDLTVGYDIGDRLKRVGLNDTLLLLTATNLFDNDPPFVNNNNGFTAVGYDPANADARGRFISLSLIKSW